MAESQSHESENDEDEILAFADAIEPVADKRGFSFCRYTDESAVSNSAKLFEKDLELEIPLLVRVKALKDNLSFKKTTVEKGIEECRRRLKPKIFDKDFEEMKKTVGRRFRNMCRVVRQGELKHMKDPKKRPAWLLKMPWIVDLPEDKAEKEGTKKDKKKDKKKDEKNKKKKKDEKKQKKTDEEAKTKKRGDEDTEKKKNKVAKNLKDEKEAKKKGIEESKAKKKKIEKKKKDEDDDLDEDEESEEEQKDDDLFEELFEGVEEETKTVDEEVDATSISSELCDEVDHGATKDYSKLIFKFDEETMLYMRDYQEGDGWEPSYPLDAEGKDSDVVIASWYDGMQNEVPGMTVKDLHLLKRGKGPGGGGGGTGRLWEATMTGVSKHDLYINQKKKPRLLLLNEQKKQVCQVNLDWFGVIEDDEKQLPVESEILQQALAILKPIGEAYAKQELQREELYHARDQDLMRFYKFTGSGLYQ